MDDGPTLEEIRSQESPSSDSNTEDEGPTDDEHPPNTEEPDETDEMANDPAINSEDIEPSGETRPDYEAMTVAQLKELLKSAGKPVSGKKADLVSRLME